MRPKIDKYKNEFIDKYKAQWVAKGFQQKYGIETFSNTIKPMIFKALFALAVFKDLEIQQWDIKSAFPNAKPIGFKENSNRVCLLNKALYGLKQSARQFYLFVANLLKELNFNSIIANQFVFYNSESNITITAHIDDLLVFAENKNEINSLKQQLKRKLELSDLGNISYYLGIEISRDRTKNKLFLSQKKYINELLSKFNINVQGVRLEKNTEQAELIWFDLNSYTFVTSV